MQRLGLDKNNGKARKYHGVNDGACTHTPANHLDRTWSTSSTEKHSYKNTVQSWIHPTGMTGIRSRSSPVLASTKKTLQVARNKTQKLCRDIFTIRNDLVYSDNVSSSHAAVPDPASKLKNELIFAEESSLVGMRRNFASYRRLQASDLMDDYSTSPETKRWSEEKSKM
ncbi:hypothetical protein HDU81_001109 [Chytriomyces hyalinus]|nr:hypothetical protein HDU81_001109 [Chytriomyces hyalinus]